jgi:hypothetical protein
MQMKKIISAILILFVFLFVTTGKANHIAGADLGYVCLGSNQYRINLNLYVDCVGTAPNSQQKIYFSSTTCGSLASVLINLVNAGGTEISQLCPSQINNSSCNGGTLPGMRVYHYSGDVVISPPCDTWIISWTSCCRNNAVTNLQLSTNSIYLEATLNSVTSTCNSSPSFTAQPIPYVCANQLVNYNFGATDPDGDSLYYSFVNAMATGPTAISYVSGYSATMPVPGIVLDPVTGQLTFTPTTIGNFVVVVLVKEYDSNGNFVGSIKRDIQFVVQSCANNAPDPAVVISDLSIAIQTGPRLFQICRNTPFSFKAVYTDQDAGDVLTLSSDLTTLFPGSTITTSGSNPLIASINWIPPAGNTNTDFTFNVFIDDGSCPVPGKQSYSYTVKIIPPCSTDTSMLFVPNVFTPGGSNPVFIISSYGLINYSIKIFDRWGDKVFESTDVTEYWNGNNVSDGTYYYVIKATGLGKKEYDKKGFVEKIGAR